MSVCNNNDFRRPQRFINAFGVFQAYYETSYLPQTSVSSIAWIGSVQTFFLFASNLVTGPLVDRFGPTPISFFYATSVAVTCMIVSLCTRYWQLLLAQGFMLGISLSAGYVPPLTCAMWWFKNRYPMAA